MTRLLIFLFSFAISVSLKRAWECIYVSTTTFRFGKTLSLSSFPLEVFSRSSRFIEQKTEAPRQWKVWNRTRNSSHCMFWTQCGTCVQGHTKAGLVPHKWTGLGCSQRGSCHPQSSCMTCPFASICVWSDHSPLLSPGFSGPLDHLSPRGQAFLLVLYDLTNKSSFLQISHHQAGRPRLPPPTLIISHQVPV